LRGQVCRWNTIVFRIRKCEFHGSFVRLPDNIMDIKNDTSSPEGTVQALIQQRFSVEDARYF